MLREEKLREVLAKLEKYSRDPFGRRSLSHKRYYEGKRRELEKELSAEELQLKIEKSVAELEALRQKGKVARLPCSGCGRVAEFDLDSVLYFAKLFGCDPNDFLLCPVCRSRKDAKRKLKRKIRKSGGMQVM